ncbi:MAG: Asp-tRNA(Asn)/Glu-tRNA(Gln) amidotransferase subunit GatB [Planctomycetota bacterium]
MSTPYEIIVGLEVHAQLKTATKLFCGCLTDFGAPPNTQTCPVCLGHPGVLPKMNHIAFDLALKTAVAFNCDIQRFTKWDRKHYYYPDLPKNFQISQYDMPFALNGSVPFILDGVERAVGLIRIHLEEDAGKLIHDDRRGVSLVDLNRTGTPLMEIVSKPDIRSPGEAYEYLNAIKLTLKYLDVSDCNMQAGSLRCDANVNLRVGDAYTPISEVKNLNSFKGVENAVAFEADRQYREFRKTGRTKHDTPKVTMGWDADRGETMLQRTKEEAHDYRYFPEPDIPPVHVTKEEEARIRAAVGELPLMRRKRYMTEIGLSAYDADVLIENRPLADRMEEVNSVIGQPKEVANFMINDFQGQMKAHKFDMSRMPIAATTAQAMQYVLDGTISKSMLRDTVFPAMVAEGTTADQVIREKGLKQVSDTGALTTVIDQVLDANPKVLAEVLGGKEKALAFLVGQVMKATRGQANAQVLNPLLRERIAKRGGA